MRETEIERDRQTDRDRATDRERERERKSMRACLKNFRDLSSKFDRILFNLSQ